ncbi:MAG: mechanosensitive ion channel family protein [Bacteroidia bacterium]
MENIDVEKITNYLIEMAMSKGLNLLFALIVLLIGLRLIRYALRLVRSGMEKAGIDSTLVTFLSSILGVVMKVMLVLSIASMVGVETTSFIAVLGAAGLAVGLALQGSLANFAGGVLIIFFKPFKVGDVIDTGSQLGVVEAISILTTHIKTFDNRLIICPNGQLANSVVVNMTAKDTRRTDIPVGIAYDSNIQKAREVMLRLATEDERILRDPEPVVRVTALGDSSVDMMLRVWTNRDDLWPVYWEMLEKIKIAFDAEPELSIPFPQRDVHLIQPK